MKRISSPMTFFWKRIFPAIWLGGVAMFLVVFVTTGAAARNPVFVIGPLMMLGFGFMLFRALVWSLVDEVYDTGDALVIRNKGREQIVPLSDIMNVNAETLMNPPRITLRLVNPGELGADVTFMPTTTFSLNPLAKSKVAEDLIERVDRARREGSPH